MLRNQEETVKKILTALRRIDGNKIIINDLLTQQPICPHGNIPKFTACNHDVQLILNITPI